MAARTLNLLIATGALKLATAAVFPVPETPFQVTWESIELTDPDRLDPFNDTHQRRLMISKFAPVPPSACLETCKVPYMSETVASAQDDQMEYLVEVVVPGEATWPRGFFADTELELCCETEKGYGSDGDAEGAFPTILFGPGLNASRINYSGFAQHLGGMGYNVIVIDHPYDASIVEYPDGSIISYGGPEPLTEEAAASLVEIRVVDASFILDTLGFTDANSVVHMGHSLGGASSAAAVANDDRIAGGVNLDGGMLGPVVSGGVDRPFLLWGSEGQNSSGLALASWAEFINATRPRGAWLRELSVEGSIHWTLLDWSIVADVYGLRDGEFPVEALFGSILGSRTMEILREYLSDFADFVLGGEEEEGLLTEPSEQFSEVLLLL